MNLNDISRWNVVNWRCPTVSNKWPNSRLMVVSAQPNGDEKDNNALWGSCHEEMEIWFSLFSRRIILSLSNYNGCAQANGDEEDSNDGVCAGPALLEIYCPWSTDSALVVMPNLMLKRTAMMMIWHYCSQLQWNLMCLGLKSSLWSTQSRNKNYESEGVKCIDKGPMKVWSTI